MELVRHLLSSFEKMGLSVFEHAQSEVGCRFSLDPDVVLSQKSVWASSRACQDAEEQRVEIVGLPCLHSCWLPEG